MENLCAWCGAPLIVKKGPGRPAKYCSRSHRQRAYESRALPSIKTIEGRQRALVEAGGICYICYKALPFDEMEFDHVIPASLGGPPVRWNLKPVHKECNAKKAAALKWAPVLNAEDG